MEFDVRDELQRLSKLLGKNNVEILLDGRAQRDEVVQLLPNMDVIHLSGHGAEEGVQLAGERLENGRFQHMPGFRGFRR